MKTTRDNYTEVRKVTENYVIEQLNNYLTKRNHIPGTSDDTIMHVIDIGISILETKHPEIGIYNNDLQGGSFVNSIVNNDLKGAFGNDDSINQEFIKFYLILMYNFSIYNLPYPNHHNENNY